MTHSLASLPPPVLIPLALALGTLLGAVLQRSGVLGAVDRQARADQAAARRHVQYTAGEALATSAHIFVEEARVALRRTEHELRPEVRAARRQRHGHAEHILLVSFSSEGMTKAAKEVEQDLIKVKNAGPDSLLPAARAAHDAVQAVMARTGSFIEPGHGPDMLPTALIGMRSVLASAMEPDRDLDPLRDQVDTAAGAADELSAALRRCCL